MPRVTGQRGQILPLGVLLLAVVLLALLFMVNAGQTVAEKLRITNAADAAAYSAAVMEARALNYDAYANRAIVANQMAIAQMLGLSSWLSYAASAVDHYHASAAPINLMLLPDQLARVAVLDVLLGGGEILTRRGKLSAQDLAQVVQPAIGVAVTLHDTAAQALALSQQLVHAELMLGLRQQAFANQLVQQMDKDMRADIVPVSHNFDSFTHLYGRLGSSGDERERLGQVVRAAQRGFSRERNWTLTATDIPWLRSGAALKKRGGTDLVDLDTWRSVDTLEQHGRLFGCGFLGVGRCADMQWSVGWGETQVSATQGLAPPLRHGNAYVENPRTAARADAARLTLPAAHFSGIPQVRDLSDLSTDAADGPRTGVSVVVHKAISATKTSGNAAQTRQSGSLAQFSDRPAQGALLALARAEAYFDRVAERADGRLERASLYNPYWRARLISPTDADRAYAALRFGAWAWP